MEAGERNIFALDDIDAPECHRHKPISQAIKRMAARLCQPTRQG
jgi:hypothetical protein